MNTVIETGIPMPVNVGKGKGDSRMNLISDALGKLEHVGQSAFFPQPSVEKADDERKHFVFRANKYGKNHGTEYVVASVAATPGTPEVPADEANGIAAKPAIAGKPAGIRIWLKSVPPVEEQAEQQQEQTAETTAPEVATV
jgi:hypothetical protein